MSSHINFASHHTPDHHVGFLFTQSSIGKYNKMSRYFVFSSYHNTKLQQSDKNISTHTLSWNFDFSYEVNQMFKHFLLFFCCATQKGNQAEEQNCMGAYRVVQTLYTCRCYCVCFTVIKCLKNSYTDHDITLLCALDCYKMLKELIHRPWYYATVCTWL